MGCRLGPNGLQRVFGIKSVKNKCNSKITIRLEIDVTPFAQGAQVLTAITRPVANLYARIWVCETLGSEAGTHVILFNPATPTTTEVQKPP